MFDILDRNTKVYGNRLIEASAGTGKTFTMEHLIIRLLLEEHEGAPPLQLKDILAVTFTRAAVRDMKQRLHHNLKNTLHLLNSPVDKTLPDYLKAIVEQGERACLKATRRIESAIYSFEECSLYTLHGFCANSLKQHPKRLLEHFSEEPLIEQIHRTVRHFFRIRLHEPLCHPVQLQKVLSLFRGEVAELEEALIKTLAKAAPLKSTFSFADSFATFCTCMQALKAEGVFESELILKDWHTLLPRYKQLHGAPAADYTPQVTFFAELLQQDTFTLAQWGQLLEAGLPLAECEENKRSKPLSEGSLIYPRLVSLLRTHLWPHMQETMHPKRIFAWMAHECQILWNRSLQLQGGGGPDRLITEMACAAQDPIFIETLRQKYKAVLVDEFQDTDHQQWHLLEKIFLHFCPLVLVGDPKQSIYAFRQADLYTYYKASQTLPKDSASSLLVNYRSDGPLVFALNALFSENLTPQLFDLPKLKSFIPYPIVQPAPHKRATSLQDGKAAIEFILYKGVKGRKKNWPTEDIEQQYFLPECVEEMIALHTDAQIPFSEMAVLVKDRHQAALVHEVCCKAGIPAFIQKRRCVLNSEAFTCWIQWLEAMLFPEEPSLRHAALLGLFLRCPQEDVALKSQAMQERVHFMAALRLVLEEKGLLAHAQALFFTPYKEGEKALFPYLLATPALHDLADDLQQILELMLEHVAKTHCSLTGLLNFLCTCKERLFYEESHYLARPALEAEAISIVTMHTSKGLEFDIVFCLGAAKRGGGEDLLVHDTQELRYAAEDDPIRHEGALERDAEKIRHAYVALTRAKKRLYVTYAIATDGSSLSIGQAAPLDLLFARFNHPPATLEELYPRINAWQGASLCDWIDTHQDTVSMRYRFLQAPKAIPQYGKPALTLIAPAPLHLNLQPSSTLSYTLSSRYSVQPKPEFAPALPIGDLPEGKDAGIFLHQLLALLPWQRVAAVSEPSQLHPLLLPYLQNSPYQNYLHALAILVYNAWHTPLPLRGKTLTLAEVSANEQAREMEFVYQDEKRGAFLRWKGAIDLFFSHAGLYYLADWKSHLLTEHEEQNSALLKQKTNLQGLNLQAAIYTKALKYYLKNIEPRPFKECFGGFVFLFLRALSKEHIGRGVVVYSEEELAGVREHGE